VVNFHIARKVIFAGAAALALTVSLFGVSAAQEADAEAQYAALLQQIEDVKLATAQKELFVNTQREKIANLRAQIAGIPATKASVDPLLNKMAAAIENEINSDYPFKTVERFARLDDFRETLGDATASPGQKMRKALNIYDFEVLYGKTVGAYVGNNPVTPGQRFTACEANKDSKECGLTDDHKEKIEAGATISDLKEELMDGAYLHYGRLALVYLEFDSSEAWRYDKESSSWTELSGGDILNVRRAVRIARGQSAPGVLAAPVNLVK
jgi:hypothetical protein